MSQEDKQPTKEKEKATVVVPSDDPAQKSKSLDEKKQEKFEKQLAILEGKLKPDNKKDSNEQVRIDPIRLGADALTDGPIGLLFPD